MVVSITKLKSCCPYYRIRDGLSVYRTQEWSSVLNKYTVVTRQTHLARLCPCSNHEMKITNPLPVLRNSYIALGKIKMKKQTIYFQESPCIIGNIGVS